ncbi:MAG TPA: hypothetical protein VGB43_00240 [Flavobacterium sp.]|jgi:hypothetical protein
MKILSILLITLLFGKGCDEETAKDVETAVIEYTANTRGFYQKINVQNQMYSVSTDRDGKDSPVKTKISDADWKMIMDAFQKVNLENLANLKAPTEKRFYDGAAIAGLKVTFKGKTYQTTDFDHGFPPAEIATLVNKVASFGKK